MSASRVYLVSAVSLLLSTCVVAAGLYSPLLSSAFALLWFLSVIFVLQKTSKAGGEVVQNNAAKDGDSYHDIEPLSTFDWRATPPLKIYPFKPKYHLTMALENLPMSELVAVDSTYVDRIHLRRAIMDKHPAATRAFNPGAGDAVLELYSWIFTTYLPARFPTMYRLHQGSQEAKGRLDLLNLVTNERIPLQPDSTLQALETLGSHVDTDFLILLPSSTAEDGSPIYHLQAFVTTFPSGFSTREKCGQPLASIHKPVPGYAAKLEKSMDRFFAKLEVGRAVKRANWSITTNDLLYSEGGNHLYDETNPEGKIENAKTLEVGSLNLEADIERQRKEVIIDDCRLRCERQTLHRLPETKALVFAFKTYQYKLVDVKADGAGLVLADAIAGLPKGSTPDINFYKRGIVWGEMVMEYLRS